MRTFVRCIVPFVAVAAVALITLNAPTRATTPAPAQARAVVFDFPVTKLQYKLLNLNGMAVPAPKANGSVKLTLEGIDLADGDSLAFDITGIGMGGAMIGTLSLGDIDDTSTVATDGITLNDLSKSQNGKKFSTAKGDLLDVEGTTYAVKAKYIVKKMKLTVTVKKIDAQDLTDVPLTLDLGGESKLKAARTINVTVSVNDDQDTRPMTSAVSDKENKDGTVKTKAKGIPLTL